METGNLIVKFEWYELMNIKKAVDVDFTQIIGHIRSIGNMDGGIVSFHWYGYTHTLVVYGFDRAHVPEIREYLDNLGAIEADVQWTEGDE